MLLQRSITEAKEPPSLVARSIKSCEVALSDRGAEALQDQRGPADRRPPAGGWLGASVGWWSHAIRGCGFFGRTTLLGCAVSVPQSTSDEGTCAERESACCFHAASVLAGSPTIFPTGGRGEILTL